MNTPGSILRTEREKQKKSLADIEKSLKVRLKYLKAIENDDYETLPPEIFLKAYLRHYAETLGIEPNHIVELYNNRDKEKSPDRPVPEAITALRSCVKKEPPPKISKKTILTVLIAVAALVSLVLFAIQKKERTAQTAEIISVQEPDRAVPDTDITDTIRKPLTPAKTLSASRPDIQVSESQPPDRSAQEKMRNPAAPVRTPAAANPEVQVPIIIEPDSAKGEDISQRQAPAEQDTLSLRITSEELTWVSVKIDGSAPKEWLIRPGSVITITADETLDVKVGNAGATKLVLNNKDLGLLGPYGKVIDITLP